MALAPRLKIEDHSFIAGDYDILPTNISGLRHALKAAKG